VKIRSPLAILVVLTALNLLNYLDRFVLAAVLDPLQTELKLSNFVGGSLATVFLIGYFATSPIFGRLADRGSRRGLIAIGVAVWSLGTIGTGLTHGTAGLIAIRALVGVGEASYATLAPTIIDDIAPPDRKGRWLSIFYMATPVGSALGYLIGGAVASRWGWRHAFFVAGGPGLLLAALCLFIQEPKRRQLTEHGRMLDDVKVLLKIPNYRRGVFGYAAYTAAVGAFAFWAPKFLVRAFKLDLDIADFRFGVVTVAGGIVGTALGGWIADRNAKRAGGGDPAVVRSGLWVCAIGSLIGVPLAVWCFLAPTANVFFIAAFFCESALFLNSSPINAVVLRAVPEERRAGAMALCITIIHLFGDLWSPPAIGLAIDHMPIRMALMILPVAIAISFLIWIPRRKPAVA
jgi:MFS family permease